MTYKNLFICVALFILPFCLNQTANSQTSAELKAILPEADEGLNSADIQQRIAVLDKLVVYKRDYDVKNTILPFKLPKEDYAYVVRKIFEKDLTQVDEKIASTALSKIEFLMRNFTFKEFAINLVHYIPKFIPNGQTNFSRVGIQYGILGTLKVLQASEFAPQIALLLQPTTARTLYRETLSTLVELRAKEAVPALRSLLYDKNYQDRYYAMESLVKLNDKAAAPHIAKLLQDENVNNRYWALDALVKLDSHRNYATGIREFLDGSTSVESKTLAIAALIDSNDAGAIPPAIELITGKDGHVRGQMAQRLIDLDAKPVIPSLIGVLNNTDTLGGDIGTDSSIRLSVIAALRGLEARESIPIFRKYIRDRNRILQTVAAQSLGEFDVKEAVDELLEMFYRDLPNPPDRITNSTYDSAAASLALAKIGDKKTWKALIDASENPQYPYRSQIIQELNKHIDPVLWKRGIESRIKGLDNKSIKVNTEAFSSESGIPLTLEYDPAKHFFRNETPGAYPNFRAQSEINLQTGLKNIILTIDSGTLPNRFTYIFDGGKVRIVTVETAVEWWRKKIL